MYEVTTTLGVSKRPYYSINLLNTANRSSLLNLHIGKTHTGLSTIKILSGLMPKTVLSTIVIIMSFSSVHRGFIFRKGPRHQNIFFIKYHGHATIFHIDVYHILILDDKECGRNPGH